MLFGLVDFSSSDYFTLRASNTTRGHEYKLVLNYRQLNIHKRFFPVKKLIQYRTISNVTLWILQISGALRHRYYPVI